MNSRLSGWAPPSTLLTIVLIFTLVCGACSNDPGEGDYKNEPPQVWISGGPLEGSVSTYKIDFSWSGYDPDGEILYYEYCITDNDGAFDPADTTGADKWTPTTKTGDTFIFSADQLADSVADDPVEEFRRSHTFFVRATDDDGAQSEETAHRSFTSVTLSPAVNILLPRRVGLNPARVPPIATFWWVAQDFVDDYSTVQDAESVSYLLEPISNHDDDWNETISWIRALPVEAPEWGEWVSYEEDSTGAMRWTTPPQDVGGYMFAIRAKDEAGAITPVFEETRNLRRVLVGGEGAPLLTVHNRFIGSIVTASLNTPLTIVDFPAGVVIQFEFAADASSYGGIETGYRYGWDVADLDDPEQWDVDWTPFPPSGPYGPPSARSMPRQFFYGVHLFTVEVMDNSGFRSRVEVKFNIVEFSMTKPLLIVDDYEETTISGWDGIGMGIEPDDAEHDAFWADMAGDVAGFDESLDVWDVASTPGAGTSLTSLSAYKSIVWSVRGHVAMQEEFPYLHDLIKFVPKTGGSLTGKRELNVLALYMAAGGHVMISGQHPVAMAIDKKYTPPGVRFPIMYKYDLDLRQYTQTYPPGSNMVENPPGDESFAYLDLCLETVDYAETSARLRRTLWHYCSVEDERPIPNDAAEYQRTRTMRAATPLDFNFPLLVLRPETAAPGKAHDPAVKGLNVEVYDPQYFFNVCPSVQRSRDCFQPIYGLDCFETAEPTYGEPVAFWTRTYEDVITLGVPGAVAAPSVVFGFPPVMFEPAPTKTAMEHIFFNVWRLPRE